jgi:hypothetical protein
MKYKQTNHRDRLKNYLNAVKDPKRAYSNVGFQRSYHLIG